MLRPENSRIFGSADSSAIRRKKKKRLRKTAASCVLCALAFSVARLFFGDERQQTNEAGSQDSIADGALEQGRGAGAATGQNSAFAVD